MGLFDMIFNESNMNAIKNQANAGKSKYLYTIDIKEPVTIETIDEELAYKIKMLINHKGLDFEMTKIEIDEIGEN